MLGVLAHQTGRGELAIESLKRAAALKPSAAEFHNNLGGVLRDLGRPADAVAAFRKALRLQPAAAEIHRNLGCALADAGRPKDAEEAFRTALRLSPFYVDAANDLGNVLIDLGRPTEAVACLEAAITLRPADPVLRNNLGLAFRVLDRLDDAVASFREAVRLQPAYAKAWSNLGNVLQEQELGVEALRCLEQAVALDPRAPDPVVNLGSALYRQRRLADAAATFRRGLEFAPASADLMWNLAQATLALGDYETGWRAFEARFRTAKLAGAWHKSPVPAWNGVDPLGGKTILLFAEQGFGDTLQFVRFVPLLAAKGARVVLLVQAALKPLLTLISGVAAVVAFGEKLPRFDVQYPLMSLPFALGIRLNDVPAEMPYLTPPAEAESRWRERVGALAGLKIGLVWAGDPRPNDPEATRIDRRRSLPLILLRALAEVGGVSFVSLQKGEAAAQVSAGSDCLNLNDWTAELHSFADTAALVQNLDLVISVDTAVAHLAGALGRPGWLLNRFDSCWRWLDGRDDSPWYPNLRQFRQSAPGDWEGVVQRVRAALAVAVDERAGR